MQEYLVSERFSDVWN